MKKKKARFSWPWKYNNIIFLCRNEAIAWPKMISVANMGSMIMFRMSVASFSEKLFKTAPSQMFIESKIHPLKVKIIRAYKWRKNTYKTIPAFFKNLSLNNFLFDLHSNLA